MPGKNLGGITGLTYDHLKTLSKNFKREVYNSLIDIHLAHTEHYSNAFAMPLQYRGGIHAEGWNWEAGGTKEEFLVAILHHNKPAKYQNII